MFMDHGETRKSDQKKNNKKILCVLKCKMGENLYTKTQVVFQSADFVM